MIKRSYPHKVNGKNVEVTRTVSVEKQEWRQHLHLVTSGTQRFVGLCSTQNQDDSFVKLKMSGAVLYLCELSFQRTQEAPGRVQIIPQLHTLMPYDGLCPVEIEIINPTVVLRVADQPDDQLKTWMYESYLQLFDPSQLARPSAEQASRILKQ